MMRAFKPHIKTEFSTFDIFSGAYLPRCCLKSEKFKELFEAKEHIEEILDMKILHAALTKSQMNLSS